MKKLFGILLAIVLVLGVTAAKPAYATSAPFVPAPYTEPTAPQCVEGQAQIINDQKFSRQEKIIVFVNVSYRWHITSQDETTVTYQLQVDVNPTPGETWVNVNGQTRTLDIPSCEPEVVVYDCPEGEHGVPADNDAGYVCVEDEETPAPTTNNGGGNPPTFAGSSTDAPVCGDSKPGDVANVNVVQGTANDGTVLVQWSLPTNADKAHILYWEVGHSNQEHGFAHALLGTPNDGNEEIHLLKNHVNYAFAVAGVNGCRVGDFSVSHNQQP